MCMDFQMSVSVSFLAVSLFLIGSEPTDDLSSLGAIVLFEQDLSASDSTSLLLSQSEGTTSGLLIFFLAEVFADLDDDFLDDAGLTPE
ncbi:hypothetical protein PGT21_003543 [Puccinia graminis f. sp. tritici]|uniref:Secreted protein n=1 Tax=Puccinia graminis f. sp. tritici TaxID=56615 RepID=A0A5B0QEI9_PUCGR|nr:hypothetical protein PGT21_003543 [Puccinia graminis f. sp. tritici]